MTTPSVPALANTPGNARHIIAVLGQPLVLHAQELQLLKDPVVSPEILERLQEAAQFLTRRTDPDEKIGRKLSVYMERWFILPKRPKGPNLYLHRVLRDDPETLHDHPWRSASWLLKGELKETYKPSGKSPKAPKRRTIRDHKTITREADFCHRLIVSHKDENQPITLFATGSKTREWGFWKNPRTFIHHLEWEKRHGTR